MNRTVLNGYPGKHVITMTVCALGACFEAKTHFRGFSRQQFSTSGVDAEKAQMFQQTFLRP